MKNADEKKAIKRANDCYDDMLSKGNAQPEEFADIRRNFDFFPEIIKRRVRASYKYFPEFYRVLPSHHSRSIAESLFIELNSIPMVNRGYGNVLSLHGIALAASIWILDNITVHNFTDFKYKLSPAILATLSDEEIEAGSEHTRIWHPSYSDEVLDLMYAFVRFHGGYLFSFERKGPNSSFGDKKAISIINDILSEEAIREAVSHFRSKVEEFYSFSLESKLQLADLLEKEKAGVSNNISPFLPLRQNESSSSSGALPNLSSLSVQDIFARNNRQQTLQNEQNWFGPYSILKESRKTQSRKMRKYLPASLCDSLSSFSVEDPYEIAFAIWYLLGTDDDFPWLYYGSISVMNTALCMLPFFQKRKQEEEPVVSEADCKSLYQAGNLEYDDFYVYRSPLDSAEDIAPNVGQLILASTVGIAPRVNVDEEHNRLYLQSIRDILGDDETLRVLWRMVGNRRIWMYHPVKYRDIEAAVNREDGIENKLEKAKEIASQFQRDNRLLRSNLHDEESLRKQAQEEKALLQNELEQVRGELAELREIVYAYENSTQYVEEDTAPVELPYHFSEKKIVSFGGHPTWLTPIREMLPDVRFISPKDVIDDAVIRNADEIWLQPNCMSHSDYYKIINAVRTQGKPLHYFKYASAEKCARQFIESR